MNTVIFTSRGGNTEKIANAIAKGAGVAAQNSNSFTLAPTDILFIGGSIYAGKIDASLVAFLETLTPDLVKKVVVFSSSAIKKTSLAQITSLLEPKGIFVSTNEFYCKGSFLFLNSGRPNAEDLKNAENFAKKICDEYTHG